MALHGLTALPFWLALAGVVLSWYMYMINPALPAAIKRAFSPIYTLLENKYYMDWFNENVIARAARALGTGLWKGGDQAIIDGAHRQRLLEAGRPHSPAWCAGCSPATSITTRSRCCWASSCS